MRCKCCGEDTYTSYTKQDFTRLCPNCEDFLRKYGKTKTQAYADCEYVCEVPPVCTAQWGPPAWIRWIDRRGCWAPKWMSLDPI